MTPVSVGLVLMLAGVFMTLGFLSLLVSINRPNCSLQAKLLPGIALTFVGAVLFALPAIMGPHS